MEEKPIHYESISEYNNLLGVETLHPLVGVVDWAEARPMRHARQSYGFYAVMLKEVKCGDLIYGRHH